MKITPLILVSVVSSAHAAIVFHSDFDEANLGAITGLNIDTPAPGAGNANDGSGTVVLNNGSETLDITSVRANMWTTRDGAPIAWVSAPSVAIGETWYAQTQLTHTNSTGGNAEYDQAGLTFYSGILGSNPGSENTGTHQSLFLGINDWNAWGHAIQGLADNDPNSGTTGVPASLADDTFEYRVEVTEGGASDTYNFFYREDPADTWTQFGPADLSQDFDNTAVGIWAKSHNNNLGTTTNFDYFTVGTVDVVPEPSTGMLAGLAGLALFKRRRK